MGIEIERKFLVKDNSWQNQIMSQSIYRQGYICMEKHRTVRVRAAEKGYLTIKGVSTGIRRSEYEYDIPLGEAEEMLASLCHKPLIEKTRYRIPHGGLLWEVDVFEAENRGLILAEVELEDEGAAVEIPEWVGAEVTGDPRYSNANLVRNPFSNWRPGQ